MNLMTKSICQVVCKILVC